MTIDIHGHVTSPELFNRFPMPPSLADIDGMIEKKSALGIDLTIVGSPVGAGTMVPVPGLDNYEQPADQLDAFHEWVAETVRDHPRQLRGYVYVNPFERGDGIERAAKRLEQDEFVGLIVNTSVRGSYLDAPEAEAFFAMAEQTGAPVLLHPPAEPVGANSMNGHLGLIEHVVRPCDITCGVAAILFAGWLNTFPGVRLIAANAGGSLPLLREKLDLAQQRMASDDVPVEPISTQLRRLYVDTATPSLLALTAAAEAFGPEHMLFGTDSPPLATSLELALDLISSLSIDQRQRELIHRRTARDLFGIDGKGGDG